MIRNHPFLRILKTFETVYAHPGFKEAIRRRIFRLGWRIQGAWFQKFPAIRDLKGALSTPQKLSELLTPDYWQKRLVPHFFALEQSRDEITSGLVNKQDKVFKAAEDVCENIFDLLGSGPILLGNQIDWHQDFKSGFKFARNKHNKIIQRARTGEGFDIKVPWELSRCQHFAWLGQAYWFSRDEKYAQEFVQQVNSWLEATPWPLGVNWTTTMEVAIRAVNWIWGFYFFRHSQAITQPFLEIFLMSLLQHGRHIINNLDKSKVGSSNHYISDLAGLIYLGLLFPEFKEAKQWLKVGLNELWSEIRSQVCPDGVYYEFAISYHRLVAELCLSSFILCRHNNIAWPEPIVNRLERMLEFTLHYTKPDGTIPIIGDNDNGRLHRLAVWDDVQAEREFYDHRHLLAIGAVLFDREDMAVAVGDKWTEAIWLLGKEAIDYRQQLKKAHTVSLSSRAFPDGNMYIMRDNDLYLIINVGGNGRNGIGNHSHNDCLSFELFAYGRTFIRDPGAYVYTSDYIARNRFRGTEYHNTIQVDGDEINRFVPDDLFRMQKDAHTRVIAWESSSAMDLLEAEHDGYARLSKPVSHSRRIRFDKQKKYWILEDQLRGEGEHLFEWRLHFDPMPVQYNTKDKYWQIVIGGEGEASLIVWILRNEHRDDDISLKDSWVSYSYGRRSQSKHICLVWQGACPTKLTAIFLPVQNLNGPAMDTPPNVTSSWYN